MSILSLARFQFAMTTVYHFFFVPFTIGTAFIVAIMESMYVHTKNESYKKMTKFWFTYFRSLDFDRQLIYATPGWLRHSWWSCSNG